MHMLVWCWFLLLFSEETMTRVSTACYGVPGIGCTDHRLMCTEPLVISITNITFGYRRGCSGQGIASCVNTACCREETGDCLTPYNQTLLSQEQQACGGESTCILNGLTDRSSYCLNGNPKFHSYSKIEYHCTRNDSSTFTKGSTTIDSTQAEADTDVGGIVGGIIGVILVIAIAAAVIFFVKRRKADKKPSKDVDHVNKNGSNRPYQTGTTIPRTTATPVYYELEKSTNNTSKPNSAKPTPGDNYDYIGGDNHVKHATEKDNYNHIGISDVTSDDEYHHLKGTNSNKPSIPDSNYNHIGSFSTVDDNYQHIGDNKTRIITDDTYNHIDGHDNTGLDSDDYHHIGGSHEHQVVTDGTYNHIGGDHNEILGNDDYHHIGNRNTQPIITDGEYSHIGGADT